METERHLICWCFLSVTQFPIKVGCGFFCNFLVHVMDCCHCAINSKQILWTLDYFCAAVLHLLSSSPRASIAIVTLPKQLWTWKGRNTFQCITKPINQNAYRKQGNQSGNDRTWRKGSIYNCSASASLCGHQALFWTLIKLCKCVMYSTTHNVSSTRTQSEEQSMWTQLVVSRLNQRLINTIFALYGKLFRFHISCARDHQQGF